MASIDKKRRDRPSPIRVRYRAYPGGPQKTKHFATPSQAKAFRSQVENAVNTGTYINEAEGRISFQDYAEEWRSVQIHGHGTEISVEQQLRLHVYPVIGHRRMNDVRTSEIQGLVRRLSTSLAPSTVEVVYGRVAAIFRSAAKDRIIGQTPCIDIRLPEKAPASTLQVLETEQVLDLAEAVPPRYKALIIAGAGLGLRPGELWGLTVDRVLFLKREVRVDQQLVRVRGEGVRLTPKLKTKSSYRTLPLPDNVAAAIAAHLEHYGAHPERGLVFTNEWRNPIQQYPFGMMFENARVRAGIPAWVRGEDIEVPTPHDLRHFYASLLIRSGASVKVVQARLGHASAKVTLDTYGHLFADEEDRTRQSVETALTRQIEDQLRTRRQNP
jgi:integrase